MSINSIVPLFSLIATALSIIGIALITLGIRGRPIFSAPRCGKCGYDLRNLQFVSSENVGNCPECGINLAEPGAVTFGTWHAQPRRIVFGVVMLILPWVIMFAAVAYARSQAMARVARTGGGGGAFLSPSARAAMPTPALLGSLKTTVDQPWDWQELERRLKAGNLAQADVDAAFGALIAHLNAKRAAGQSRQPLHWAGDFLNAAIAGGNVSQPQVLALAQAYYGNEPKFTLRSRARQDEPIAVTLNEYEPWNLPKMQFCWALTDITADGTVKLTAEPRYPRSGRRANQPVPPMKPDQLSGNGRDGEFDVLLPQSLPPGEHEIAFTFEMGVVAEQATMRGLDGKPGTPDKWPTPIARWQAVAKRKVTIQPKEQSPVKLNVNPTSNPFTGANISIAEALARPSSKGVELVIKFNFPNSISPLVAYRIWVQAGEQKIDYGTMLAGRTSRGVTQGATDRKVIPALAAEVKQIDILLEPDTKVAEQHTGIEEIWGKPLQLTNVPLQRFDLGDGGPSGGAAGGNREAPATQAR